jgi:hypothetical protein
MLDRDLDLEFEFAVHDFLRGFSHALQLDISEPVLFDNLEISLQSFESSSRLAYCFHISVVRIGCFRSKSTLRNKFSAGQYED